jgi:hypothetical protein
MHTVKYLKEKNHIIFSYNKNSKICINMHFGLKTSLLKSQELGQYLKNFKNVFFSFIWDYDLIRKMYSGY